MPTITFVDSAGTRHSVHAPANYSAMQSAVMESIPGIVGECGGNLVCATCHVYVDEQWAAKVGPPGSLELAMLDLVPEPRPCSRLSCQITLTADLDGLILHTPASQR